MNPEIRYNLPEARPEDRLPWHKPEIQQITVSLDTAAGTGSASDGNGAFQPFVGISDMRAKQDISGIANALQGLLAVHGARELEHTYPEVVATRKDGSKSVNYALLVPVLVEAIKEQQAMIEDLKAQVKELH